MLNKLFPAMALGVLSLTIPSVAHAAYKNIAPDNGPKIRPGSYFRAEVFGRPIAMSTQYQLALKSAACIASANRMGTADALGKDAGSKDETPALQAVALQNAQCAQRGMAVSANLFRAALAETLWKQAGAIANPFKRQDIAPEELESFLRVRPYGDRNTTVRGMPLYVVARCQVMVLPEQSAKVLATKPGSSAERREVRTLFTHSGHCGLPNFAGAISPMEARAALADAFYQESVSKKL